VNWEQARSKSKGTHPGLFSRIVRGEEQQWRVWDDERHVAFLTPFPNSPGFTVLVPRRPLTSDIFRLEKADYEGLVLAARKVSQLLEQSLGANGVANEIIYVHFLGVSSTVHEVIFIFILFFIFSFLTFCA
uniref:HIT domain-containing protein n=1 Tax=Echeneis naucrates TaxID=173247 RepID=A0A665T1W3_ECHNA